MTRSLTLTRAITSTLAEILPTRHLITADGEAIGHVRWLQLLPHHDPEIIWVRNDKWSLACTEELANCGYQMWQTEWIGAWHRFGRVDEPAKYTFLFRGDYGWNRRQVSA